MANLLYLVHRLPYPPNKGDKVRSYHLLKHLARQHRIYLGTFVDDPDDFQYLDTVREYCAELHVETLHPRFAKVRSLTGLLMGEALSLPYYRNAGMQRWVGQVMPKIDGVVVFSSVMAQYVPDMQAVPTLIDFVDADSAKWSQYATTHRWPMSWVYRREGRYLLDFERQVARQAQHSFFVTEAEASLFTRQAPECQTKVAAMCNGVDAEFFAPSPTFASPFAAEEQALVFTGAMDYWPNIDAVTWVVQEMLPSLREQFPNLRFYIVGRSPTVEVQALACEHVVVTGTVSDVRPYLQYAAVVTAPLRIARGVQNKVLEAMAMARPVVTASTCASAITAQPGRDLLAATTAAEHIEAISSLLQDPVRSQGLGTRGRDCVLAHYSWDAHLGRIDHYLPKTGNGSLSA